MNKLLFYAPILSNITNALNDKSEKVRNFALNNLNSPFMGIVIVIGVIAFVFIAFGAFKR